MYEENDDVIKESKVIANFASSSYLENDLGHTPLIHGKGHYLQWNSNTHVSCDSIEVFRSFLFVGFEGHLIWSFVAGHGTGSHTCVICSHK